MSEKIDTEIAAGMTHPNLPISTSVVRSASRFISQLLLFLFMIVLCIIAMVVNASSLVALVGPVGACCLIVVTYAESFKYTFVFIAAMHIFAMFFSQGDHPMILGASLDQLNIWLQGVLFTLVSIMTWMTKPIIAPSVDKQEEEKKGKEQQPESPNK